MSVILWALVLMSVLSGAISLALANANREAEEATRAVLRRHGMVGAPGGCILAVLGFLNLGLWIALAISAGDWRFAAISAVPFSLSTIGRLVSRAKRTEISS